MFTPMVGVAQADVHTLSAGVLAPTDPADVGPDEWEPRPTAAVRHQSMFQRLSMAVTLSMVSGFLMPR